MTKVEGEVGLATLTTLKTDDTAETQAKCDSFTHVMRILGKRWTGLILRELLAGPRRYNEMLAAIPGLSDPLLTQRLRELEAEGLVERCVIASQPVRVEYLLTSAGCDLAEPLRVLEAWGDRWLVAR